MWRECRDPGNDQWMTPASCMLWKVNILDAIKCATPIHGSKIFFRYIGMHSSSCCFAFELISNNWIKYIIWVWGGDWVVSTEVDGAKHDKTNAFYLNCYLKFVVPCAMHLKPNNSLRTANRWVHFAEKKYIWFFWSLKGSNWLYNCCNVAGILSNNKSWTQPLAELPHFPFNIENWLNKILLQWPSCRVECSVSSDSIICLLHDAFGKLYPSIIILCGNDRMDRASFR